jgi:hypothetical protein
MDGVEDTSDLSLPNKHGKWDFFISFATLDRSGWFALDWLSNLIEWTGGVQPAGLHLTAIGMRGDEDDDGGGNVVFDFICEVDANTDLQRAIVAVGEYNFHMCDQCRESELNEIESWLATQGTD